MQKRQVTNIEVKKNNRNRIFRYIRQCGITSNPDIAYELKISLPTVTQNTKELLERGLIKENGEFKSTGGRRAKALTVASDYRLAAGVDITRNHVGMLLSDFTGEILKYERIQLPYCDSLAYYEDVSKKLEKYLEDSVKNPDQILGIGISFPGIVDQQKKEITFSHALNVKALPFEKVSRCFSYPCRFFNDANAGAYAEGIFEENVKSFFYLSLSNTVGGAFFNRDTLMQGSSFRCGEVGHMTIVPEGDLCYCGKKGCLDAYCSARRLSDLKGGKLEQFFRALSVGEKEVVKAWEKYISYLSVAVNNIHMILDCDVIIGGYMGSYAEDYIQDIRYKVSERNTFEEDGGFVKACKYKIGAAALGAARNVIEEYVEQV